MHSSVLLRIAAFLAIAAAASSARATDVTSSFTVSMQINPICSITSAGDLTFSSTTFLDSPETATSTINVKCTNGTPFNIGLSLDVGETVSARVMNNGSNTLTYAMYSDSGHNTAWGETAPTDTLNGTGDGSAHNYTVYGNLPAQTPPATGSYTDPVTVTVTY
jgi:spore coat protein U-like protein